MSAEAGAVLYRSSVKIEMTSKGVAMVTVHYYNNDSEFARTNAVEMLLATLRELKAKGVEVAGTWNDGAEPK